MSREVLIPLAAVEALINSQRDFNRSLVDLLGAYLEKASINYRDAFNPPMDTSPSVPMSYSTMTDEADDLMHQIETGQLNPDQIPDALRRLVHDTDISMDPT